MLKLLANPEIVHIAKTTNDVIRGLDTCRLHALWDSGDISKSSQCIWHKWIPLIQFQFFQNSQPSAFELFRIKIWKKTYISFSMASKWSKIHVKYIRWFGAQCSSQLIHHHHVSIHFCNGRSSHQEWESLLYFHGPRPRS